MNIFSKELTLYLNSLNIPAVRVEYYNTNYINIYVNLLDEINECKKLIRKYHKEIIERILLILDSVCSDMTHRDFKWEIHSINNIYSINELNMENSVYSMKMQFIDLVQKKLSVNMHPEFIYCHSSSYKMNSYGPGYYVLFKDNKTLKKSFPDIQQIIMKIAVQLLKNTDGFRKDRLDVYFSHTNDHNMCGPYRED